MDFGNTPIIIAFLAVLFSVVLVGYSFMLTGEAASETDFSHSEERFEEFTSAELEDECAVPEGYDEEGWKEHMSHHPDRYQECLL